MDISSTLTAGTTPAVTPQASGGGGITADFQTFLTLLTSQLRNQDPLKPMESTQFVAQLATFSSVEQQVMSNEKLDTLVASLRASDAVAIAGWIDRDVETRAAVPFNGEPIPLILDGTPANGDRLVVRNALGEVVSDQAFTRLEWSGSINGGLQAPAGNYTFERRASVARGDQLLEVPRTLSTVSEARLGDDGAQLRLANGQTVALSDIVALR